MADKLGKDQRAEGFALTGACDIDSHESVWTHHDPASGLRSVIAIHSTALGPALGGTRFLAYDDDDDALADVLRLAEGMTYKAAAAGLGHGGGKAVIIGDPRQLRSQGLLAAYGGFVEDLHGMYITAADIGTDCADMDLIARTTTHVVGRSREAGGSGDSGISTARGVYKALEAVLDVTFGLCSPRDLRVGVEGAGKVGARLVSMLASEGATVLVTDPSRGALERMGQIPNVMSVPTMDGMDIDVYVPCALGGTLTMESVEHIRARIVCGAANNQLASPDVDAALADKGIVWVPDYVANAGGLIQVAGEAAADSPEAVGFRIDALGNRVREILAIASTDGIPTGAAARRLVDRRLVHADTQA